MCSRFTWWCRSENSRVRDAHILPGGRQTFLAPEHGSWESRNQRKQALLSSLVFPLTSSPHAAPAQTSGSGRFFTDVLILLLQDSSSFAETPVTTGMTQEAPVTTDMTWEAAEEHVTGLSQATAVSKKWCWAASAHRGDKGRCVTQRTWKSYSAVEACTSRGVAGGVSALSICPPGHCCGCAGGCLLQVLAALHQRALSGVLG